MPVVSHSSTPLYVDWAQRYEIVRKVGAGGFAEVYEAYDRKLERPVALKVIADRPGMSGRVVREVEAAASLAHPGIVALYDFFGDGERSFLVWEFVEGQPLAAALGELGDADAAHVGEELAEALAYAHSQGVIHRDIKPQNVMIDDEGRAKLMDFGIARLMDAQTLTSEGDVLGTVAYMSPEQASSRRIGPASDVYSLGIVLYELLAGFNPVRGHTPAETMANVVAGRIEPLEEVRPDLPRGLTDAVAAAIETEAAERPSAAAVAAELRAALESGRLGHGRLQAWRVLRPLQRFAVLGERAAGAGLAAVVSAVLLSRFATYPESWTLPVMALSAALWFVVPQLGLAWLLGVLAFPVFAVSFSLGVVYIVGAVALYWLTRGRPLVALWPALAVLLVPVYATLLAPAGAAVFGRLRGPLVAAWAGAGTLFYLLLERVSRSPYTGFQPRGHLATQLQAAGNPLTAAYRVLAVTLSGPSLLQMAVWAGLALAVTFTLSLRPMLVRLWAWSLSMCLVFVLYRVVPIRLWDYRVSLSALLAGVSVLAVVVLFAVVFDVGQRPEERRDERP